MGYDLNKWANTNLREACNNVTLVLLWIFDFPNVGMSETDQVMFELGLT